MANTNNLDTHGIELVKSNIRHFPIKAESRINFYPSEAYSLAKACLEGYKQKSMTNKEVFSCVISEIQKLCTFLQIFEGDHKVNRERISRLDNIALYNLNTGKFTNQATRGTFCTEKDFEQFSINRKERTNVAVTADAKQTLECFEKLWGTQDRSLVIANLAVMTSVLITLRVNESLTPYSSPVHDKSILRGDRKNEYSFPNT
jgi:hypothetical protein